ncbi:MAG TPA: hypothetical protein DEO32_02680 [Ruminococcaceae bacterium]|nr:hypothetical protein [Oscillospiraceae bacterium]
MASNKVGILTFHQALSYGAKLQAYALQQFLTENGIENDIIDYTCKYMYNTQIRPIRFWYKKKLSVTIKDILRSFITMRQVGIERDKTIAFRQKHLNLSRPFDESNISEAAGEYRAFITGSDQVWSPTVVGFDKVYFLNFAKPKQKYSYAASVGGSKVEGKTKDEYRSLLSDFQKISVREPSAAQLVNELTGKEAVVSPDPTLLFTSEKWDGFAQRPEGFGEEEKYIFLFNVNIPKRLFNFAQELGKRTGLKIYSIQKNKRHHVDGVTYIDPVSANEFVWLIKNAEYVVTNSFHATAFSLIYHKNFFIEFDTQGTRNVRSEQLLQRLRVTGREITAASYPETDVKTDWDYAESKLDELRQAAKTYIAEVKQDIYG